MLMARTQFKYNLSPVKEDFLCLAVVLGSIINAQYINKFISYEDIAEFFGVNVPNDYVGSIKNIKYTDDFNLMGIIIKNTEINDLFQSYNIPLIEYYISINSLSESDLEERIICEMNKGSHIFCSFGYDYLYRLGQSKRGHISIITEINKNIVTLLDPGPINAGNKEVSIIELYDSMHFKQGGLSIVQSIR